MDAVERFETLKFYSKQISDLAVSCNEERFKDKVREFIDFLQSSDCFVLPPRKDNYREVLNRHRNTPSSMRAKRSNLMREFLAKSHTF